MKNGMLTSTLAFLALFGGCMPSVADSKDVIGHWRGRDKAELVFYNNGTFKGDSLPSEMFLSHEYGKVTFYGNGTWEIAGKQDPDVINIVFSNISIQKSKNGFVTQILLDKSDSVPILYMWEGEEGGDRYKFFKQDSNNSLHTTIP